MGPIDDPITLLLGVVVLIGAVIQGSVGFGFSLVVAPVAMLVRPELVPGSIATVSLSVTLAIVLREWRTMGRPAGLFWILLGLFPGFWLGSRLLLYLPPRETALFFGIAVLIAVGISFSGMRIRPRPATLSVAGLVAGVMSITTTMGGPPQAIALQELPGPRLRGSLALSFTIGSITSLALLHSIGKFGGNELRMGLTLIPFAIPGFVLSALLARWLDRGSIRTAVLLLAALAGVAVIVQHLYFPPIAAGC
ncbi:MAG: sulfite exporter TauE/SafE family protein [Magnetococcales bacterium]|nr:sulfite exporter TauE/SafE family protein [Magnetococcales bacterium]